ncbi:HK97 family phage prohead protease [Emcibacter nanhaiensis]|uniref:HK97 family phage prohead protease n=1 Tax=Emcibacter nanhaiensis TaxID=1505037 RepID=A0A501PBK2_9PROT|nr:HK97 family phage prohead protease [Emcibacter nanhaiensis]TPD57753.1 HK97 family phage prohead protease [Emcibacter nanhaiensis]
MTDFLTDDRPATTDGRFEGYASVFNVVDNGNDLVVPGAFRRSLQDRGARGIKLLWQHDPREPVGVIEEAFEDHYGLFVRARLLTNIRRAEEAHGLVRSGALDGLSIGFHTQKADRRVDGSRILREVDLWEVSLVTFPMNDKARILSLKGEERPTSGGPSAAQAGLLAAMHHLSKLMTQER